MVYVVLIIAAAALMAFAMGLLPAFPATPSYLEGVASTTVDIISTGLYLMSYLIGQHLFFGTLILLSAVLLAEPIYHGVMWVLRKIPVLNIN